MKFLSLVSLATMALAAPSVEKRAPTPLDVKLEMVGNSEVKATVTNTGKSNLKVFKTGTILDSAPIEKAQVYYEDQEVEFDGVRFTMSTENLEEAAFERIGADESVEVTFDVAELHDLSVGGKFDITVAGAFSTAEEDSTVLSGSVPYVAESIKAEVDGDEASFARVAFHQKRTIVQSDCSGTRLSASTAALSACVRLATTGQNAATSGAAAKMTEFFKSSTSATRSTVSGVFSRMRSECGSSSGGGSRWYCTDVYGACSGGVIAYTVPASAYMAYCPLFFSMPATSTACYTQNRASTAVHEMTHLRAIRGTSDYGGYGYNFVRSLSASQNINHADTYTLFAQAIQNGC